MKRILIFLILASTVLANDYPGLPDFGERYNGDNSTEAANSRVHYVYFAISGKHLKSPHKIVFKKSDRENILGTTHQIHIQDNSTPAPTTGTTSKVEVYDGSVGTLHHELSHSYSNAYAYTRHAYWQNKFLEEGMAEMVAWSIDPKEITKSETDRLKFLKGWVRMSDGDWKKFRNYIGRGIDKKPDAPGYALAGFFVSQWFSAIPKSRWPDALDCIVLAHGGAREIEHDLNSLLARCKITPEQFWKQVYENAVIWSQQPEDPPPMQAKVEPKRKSEFLSKYNIEDFLMKDSK